MSFELLKKCFLKNLLTKLLIQRGADALHDWDLHNLHLRRGFGFHAHLERLFEYVFTVLQVNNESELYYRGFFSSKKSRENFLPLETNSYSRYRYCTSDIVIVLCYCSLYCS
jgi:hypothetical protein